MNDPAMSPVEQAFYDKLGAELRQVRESAGLSQQAIADLYEWNRDAVSKFETGKRRMSLFDYLRFIDLMREQIPAHPAVPLADHMLAWRRIKPRAVG
jgi:DNA-binding XRE family transcriptional regulator